VTVLTSHDAAELESIFGTRRPGCRDSKRSASRERHCRQDCAAFVASGQELGLLREALGPDAWIVVPGIRAPGDPPAIRYARCDAAEAVRRRRHHLVVGRPITAARDPVAVSAVWSSARLRVSSAYAHVAAVAVALPCWRCRSRPGPRRRCPTRATRAQERVVRHDAQGLVGQRLDPDLIDSRGRSVAPLDGRRPSSCCAGTFRPPRSGAST